MGNPKNMPIAVIALVLVASTSSWVANCQFSGLPTIPGFPSVPTIPGVPSVPTTPGVPSLPTIPRVPSLPTLPGFPSLPTIPRRVPSNVTVFGVLRCSFSIVPRPMMAVNVTLSCDGGRTALVRPVMTSNSGFFTITVNGANATLVDPTRCRVIASSSVAGCAPIRVGQALQAPVIPITQLIPIIGSFLRVFTTGAFALAPVVQ